LRNLVTGGLGFIGSHLVNKLISNNEKVICLDNFETGSTINIKGIENHPHFKLIKHDVINPMDLRVDRIWHLACPASPRKYLKNPIKTLRTNFLGTYNVLSLARETNAKVLLASSSEIYGNSVEHPQSEDYFGNVNPLSRRSCYEEGKRISETLFYNFNSMYGIDIAIARIFNTYGAGMLKDDGRVINNFIHQALDNKPITIYGNGDQTRTFCYIDDLINGLLLQMESNYKNPINLGGNQEVKILNVAKIIRDKINPKLNIMFSDLPEDDPLKRKPNLETAKNILNWKALVNLNDGINITIDKLKEK
tara:strand:+ start:769 stop:1689 length:921 start_codon:yes stop_codon:yes gene_type:complete